MKSVYEHKREVERRPLRFAHRKPEYKECLQNLDKIVLTSKTIC